MRRSFAFAIFVSTLALAVSATAQEATRFLPFAPVSEEAAALEIAPGEGPRSASRLTHETGCSETKLRTGEVFLAWTPASGGLAQRVDVSKFRDGFETGAYETSGPLSGALDRAALEGPEPGIRYYWRVLTDTGGSWAASATERFEAPTCASDLTILDEGR